MSFNGSTQAATLNVPSSQYPTVQSAVNAANAGDTIILQAGTTFTESVILKYKPGNDYITIQSSALAGLPPEGHRVNPSHAQFMPKIVPPLSADGDGAISTEITVNGPAHHYRLLGIEFAQTNPNQLVYNMLSLGGSGAEQNTLAKVANHFIVDRCYIHGHPNGELRRGIALNSSHTSVTNSYISEVHQVGTDTQAIGGWNGPGPYLIVNNHLEAAGENLIFGGSDPAIQNLVPSDIEIRRNYFYKPPHWKNRIPAWTVKNSFELKNARRVTIDGNVFENSWAGGQNGEAIVLTVRNQSGGAPWSTLEDITVTNNIIKRVWNGFNFLGRDNKFPSGQAKNFLIKNNLLTEINPQVWCAGEPNCPSEGRFVFNIARMENITFDHNTSIQANSVMSVESVTNGLVYKNNLHPHGSYGITSPAGIGTPAFTTYFQNYTFLKNVIAGTFQGGNWSSRYPNAANNFFPLSMNDVGFVDHTNPNVSLRNYRLSPTSPYRNQGTDGKDVGADFDELNQATCGVTTGAPCAAAQNQTAYPGPNSLDIPATLEAENFDRGGQGVAYIDTFGAAGSGAYRSNPAEAVDVSSSANASNGFVVNEAAAGEWLEYTVNVPTARNYELGFRYASEFGGGKFHLEDCGGDAQNQNPVCANLTGEITIASTGGWNNFRVVTKRGVRLSAGTHLLRLKLDANSTGGCNCVVANFDAITFKPTLFDFDDDGRADVANFRPSSGDWFLQRSRDGFAAVTFGASTDVIVPADYDGDGRTDIAVYRPANGAWYVQKSSLGFVNVQFGAAEDIPVPADYDADGKTDIAVFRPSSGTWHRIKSSDGEFLTDSFGQIGDRPATGDYDGDGKSDLAVFRPTSGIWYIQNSSSGGINAVFFGSVADKIVPADYDGDGKADVAVYRPANGIWYLHRSSRGFVGIAFGAADDIPAPADYDGDGKVDVAVFRPSTGVWYLSRSAESATSETFGQIGDVPIPSTYVR